MILSIKYRIQKTWISLQISESFNTSIPESLNTSIKIWVYYLHLYCNIYSALRMAQLLSSTWNFLVWIINISIFISNKTYYFTSTWLTLDFENSAKNFTLISNLILTLIIHYLYLVFKGRTWVWNGRTWEWNGRPNTSCVAITLRTFDKDNWTTKNVTISDGNEHILCDLFCAYCRDPLLQLTVVKNIQKERWELFQFFWEIFSSELPSAR